MVRDGDGGYARWCAVEERETEARKVVIGDACDRRR